MSGLKFVPRETMNIKKTPSNLTRWFFEMFLNFNKTL